MPILDDLLSALPPRQVALREVRIGAFWTLVWSEQGAGLASTQRESHAPHRRSPVRWAGNLLDHSAQELAGLLRSNSPVERSLGMAAVNALLDVDDGALSDGNASQVITQRGVGKRVVIIGHFPFIPTVRRLVGHLDVLELDPEPGDLPANAAQGILPQADVVAITGTTLLNGTFDNLISLCQPNAYVLLLGPTTPLTPLLFDYGVKMIAGTRVVDPQAALITTGQGAAFTQMHGVRLVTMVDSKR
jgi:uncharacterized protein (DUF4213/DUF364 family)